MAQPEIADSETNEDILISAIPMQGPIPQVENWRTGFCTNYSKLQIWERSYVLQQIFLVDFEHSKIFHHSFQFLLLKKDKCPQL